MKEKSPFSVRLIEARRIAGLSLSDLAERMNHIVSRQCLSFYEQGRMQPKPRTLKALAYALDISEAYLRGGGVSINRPMLRSSAGSKLTEEQFASIESALAYQAEQYLQLELRHQAVTPFVNPLDRLLIDSLSAAVQAADQLREMWNCGDGPIPSVIRLLERKGIKVFDAPLPEGVMGLSTWTNDNQPLIWVDSRTERSTIERLRFTVAHELGHLLLRIAPELDHERACNQFAGVFLFPHQTLIEELGGSHRDSLTLTEVIDLHQAYGISVAALVHTAKDLGIISIEHYNWWFDELINKNKKEESWGSYPIPERPTRQLRLLSRDNKR